MNACSAGRGLLAFLAFAPLSACDDSTGPPPVSTVEVAGVGDPLKVGESVQLTATVRDANGNELMDRDVIWSSSDDSVASVDTTTGLVTGESVGAVTITATSEGMQGDADISVFSEVALTSISPAVLRAGDAATLTGEGFSTALSANLVLVGGERATVTEATPTELKILVSGTACQVTGEVDVQVTVDPAGSNEEESNVLNHSFEAEGGTPFSLDVGQLALIEASPDFCLRFGATSQAEAYLIGLQSTATSVGTVTPAMVSAATAGAGATAARAELGDVARYRASAAGVRLPPAQTAGLSASAITAAREPGARWQRHRQTELSLRSQEVQLLAWARPLASPGSRSALANVAARSTGASRSIVADVQVGDTVPIRVPKLDDVCEGFDSISTIVRLVGDHAVWLEDVDNPAGGYTSNDFEQLNQVFDNRIHETNVEHFGEPLDLDENGRIGVVTTKEVNARENVLGFVSAADLFDRATCASSDFGELYYGRTPDPNGEFGEEYTLAAARLDAPQLIAHEFAHIIQFSGVLRLQNPPVTAVWNLEGQALIAEELNGHAATGRSTGQNYGFDVAWTGVPGEGEEQTEIAWYFGGFVDLFVYYGFRDRESSVSGAPEECSWLGLEDDGNDGPCQAGREVYGVPWSILRWLTDHFSADVGGEAPFHRGLVERGSSGFPAIAELVPVSRNRWLAEWAAALYVDDRIAGADSRLTLPSWNLVDIETGIVETAHLRPRQRAFEGFSDDVNVRAGSTAYFCIGRAQQGDSVDCLSSASGRPETVLRARDALGANLPSHMQLWVVRLN